MRLVFRSAAVADPDLPRGAANVTAKELARTADAAGSEPTARYVWYAIGLLTVINVSNYMDRMALAVLLPFIKQDLILSDSQLGLLIGFAFSAIYAICGIPLARWADRGTRRDIIALALTTWSVMTALCGGAQNFWHLFLARVGVGVGEAGCLPGSQSMLCDYVPAKRRPGVFAIHNLGMFVGVMLGMALAGWFGEVIGWRWAFVVLGLPGVALALLVRLTLREPTRGRFDNVQDLTVPSLSHVVNVLWRCRTYRYLLAFVVVNGFVQYGLTQWWPSFYSRVFGLSIGTIGAYLGLALGGGSSIGILLGGAVANKAAEQNAKWPLMIGGIATLCAIPTAAGSLVVNSVSISIALAALTGFFWSVSLGPVVATTFSIVSPRMRAITGATNAFLISMLGMGLGPLSVGIVSDLLSSSLGAQSLRYALFLPVSLFPVMAIVLFAASRTAHDDLRAAGAQL